MGVEQDFRTEAEPEVTTTGKNWLGITAFLSGLLGLSLVALVLGIFGLRAVQRGHATNRGLSVAGLVLAAIGFVGWIAVGALAVLNADSSSAAAPPPPGSTRYVLTSRGGTDTSLVAPAAAYLASHVKADVSVGKNGRSIVVVFKAPATADQAAALVTAHGAQFRPVIASAPPAAGGGDVTASQSAAEPAWTGDEDYYVTPALAASFKLADCTKPVADPDASPSHDQGVVSCVADGSAKLLLGGVSVDASDVEAVRVNGAVVNVVLTDHGQHALRDVTTHLARAAAPANALAIVTDGLVVSAPQVQEPMPGAAFQVALPDAAAAQRFAGTLAFGSNLLQFTVTASH